MASIIRLKNLPRKWFFYQNEILLCKNGIISLEKYKTKYDKISLNKKEDILVKDIVKNFILKKQEFYCMAYQKNLRKYQAKFIIELLVFLAGIISKLEKEAQAIVKVASEICQKITCYHKEIDHVDLCSYVHNNLANFIDIKIYLPGSTLKDIENRYHFLLKVFNNKQLYFSLIDESNARLDICICKKLCQLHFHYEDIDIILSSIRRHIISES
jgi:hypothetical protein